MEGESVHLSFLFSLKYLAWPQSGCPHDSAYLLISSVGNGVLLPGSIGFLSVPKHCTVGLVKQSNVCIVSAENYFQVNHFNSCKLKFKTYLMVNVADECKEVQHSLRLTSSYKYST